MLFKSGIISPVTYFFDQVTLAMGLHYGEIHLEMHETYQKSSLRNRTKILSANGIQTLSVPLKQGKNQHLPIRDVKIAYDEDWMSLHKKSIASAYGGSPFYIHYEEMILSLYDKKIEYLYNWNIATCREMIAILKLDIQLVETVVFQKEYPDLLDFRKSKANTECPDLISDVDKPSYPQVFGYKMPFYPNLSSLDLLFCLGPYTSEYLRKLASHLLIKKK
jgi:hypothetical protein